MATNVIAFAVALPMLLPLGIIMIVGITGRTPTTGLWRSAFKPSQLSPTRIYQSMATLCVAGDVLIGLAQNDLTAFVPVPHWLFAVAGSGNFAYLGAKYAALKKSQTANRNGE